MDYFMYSDVRLTTPMTDEGFALRQKIRGEVSFIPKEDVLVKELGFKLLFELRGRCYGKSEVVHQEKLADGDRLMKGERYTFPIEFSCEHKESFVGKNASYLYKIEPYALPSKEVKRGIVRNITDKLGMTKTTLEPFFITFYHPGKPRVRHKGQPFYFGTYLSFLIVLISFILPLCIAHFMLEVNFLYGLIPGVIALFVGLVQYLFSLYFVGKTSVYFQNEDYNEFTIILENEKNWKGVADMQVWYQLMERVEDKRGTSTSVSVNTIYTSISYVESAPFEEDFLIHLPCPEGYPTSRKFGDGELYYILKIKIKSKHFFSYEQEERFEVYKEF